MDHFHSLAIKLLPPLYILFFFVFSINAAFHNLKTVSFDEKYSPLFSDFNIHRADDGHKVGLHLDRYSGSGFISSNLYNYGFFSANIKLPGQYTSGIVVAFYTSNGDVFEKSHDELDIEFLGAVPGRPWRFQTNLYGNGSTQRGREERYRLWFDPSKDYHRYSILWTEKNVIFYVDDVPIREVVRNDEMGGDYPAKPMALYATIWDASNWATSGGKYKVNYKYEPFVSEFKDFVLDGCPADPIQQIYADDCTTESLEQQDYSVITPSRRAAMRRFRQKYMYYSYCYDAWRYNVTLPECVIDPAEKRRFKESGRLKFGGDGTRRQSKRSRRQRARPTNIGSEDETSA